jgi:hypothetical protein
MNGSRMFLYLRALVPRLSGRGLVGPLKHVAGMGISHLSAGGAPLMFFYVLFVGHVLWAQPAAPMSPVSKEAPVISPAAVATESVKEIVPEAEDEPEIRDPFLDWLPPRVTQVEIMPSGGGFGEQEPEKPVFNPNAYKVTGIVWGIEKAKAIINGKIFGVGDKVLDAEILKIDRDGVRLRFEGDEYLLARGTIDGNDSEGVKK